MIKLYIATILLTLALSSPAQLKKFTVEVPVPPSFKISDSIQSFTLMNRSMTPEFSNIFDDSLQVAFYRKNFDTNYIIIDSLVADTTLKVLGDLLYDSYRYDIVIPVDRNLYRTESYLKTPDPLDWETVNSICETYQTDALIVLENIATRVVTNYTRTKELIDFTYYNIHLASMDFYYRAHWRVYDPKVRQVVVDILVNQDTLYWDNYDYSLVEVFRGLPSVKEAAIETGIKTALDFSQIIAPSWIPATRYYYLTKNQSIDLSVQLAAEGKWNEALENWLPYAYLGSNVNQSKIMLNIALAYEMTGDLNSAIEWAKKSMQTFYREVTNHYLKELLKRQLAAKK
ncbi:MAG: hypothetical protein JXR22_01700 [Prolixibacteraceae bacterium]|nr:hypothetical protein [Prolixibacteraceae bacterium]